MSYRTISQSYSVSDPSIEAAQADPELHVSSFGHETDDSVIVREVKEDVISRCEPLPKTDGVHGGVVCTGFFDVEKLVFTKRRHKTLLVEKKLPFQLLIVELDP